MNELFTEDEIYNNTYEKLIEIGRYKLDYLICEYINIQRNKSQKEIDEMKSELENQYRYIMELKKEFNELKK